MSISLSESEFIENLLSLASIHPLKLDDNYAKSQAQLENLGPALKPFSYSFTKTETPSVEATTNVNDLTKTIILKSLKPKAVLKVKASDFETVQDIKDYLDKTGLPGQYQFKLLNKGKVLLDYVLVKDAISEVNEDEVTFNVMSKAKPDDLIEKEAVETKDKPQVAEEKPEIVIPWNEFNAILEAKYGSQESEKIIKKLQKVWNSV
ncbi:unnamed protein product [Hanseniaspora opuntiae]